MNKWNQNKWNQNKFLQTRIKYDDSYCIKDVLNECSKDIFLFVSSNPEVEFDYEEETFMNKFYQFIYHNYYKQKKDNFEPYDEELYLYFSLKFSQDIVDLFMKFKEITRSYNLHLFHKRDDISLYLEDFLFNTLLIEDPYYDDCESGTDEENNISSIIDETSL